MASGLAAVVDGTVWRWSACRRIPGGSWPFVAGAGSETSAVVAVAVVAVPVDVPRP